MSDDALDRLMKQKRPSVKPRSDKLDTNEQMYTDTNTSVNNSSHVSSYSNINNKPLVRVTRKSVLIEDSVEQDATQLCKQEGIIIATLFEAAFRYLEQNPEAREKIVADAKARVKERKESARIRQAESFSEKLRKYNR